MDEESRLEVEAIIDAFETGRGKQEAAERLEIRRVELLLPLLRAVEDSWAGCREAERHYHRHSFRENLACIGMWAFIVLAGGAPVTAALFYVLFAAPPTIGLTAFASIGLLVGCAWLRAPCVPPWNVQDRRARAVTLATEVVLEGLRAADAGQLTEQHHQALSRVLAGCTNSRSATGNVMLAIASLRALEQVGDGRFVAGVERLARRERGILRDAAEACLPTLIERRDRESRFGSLLRPVHTAAADLVRPAGRVVNNADRLVIPLESVENQAA